MARRRTTQPTFAQAQSLRSIPLGSRLHPSTGPPAEQLGEALRHVQSESRKLTSDGRLKGVDRAMRRQSMRRITFAAAVAGAAVSASSASYGEARPGLLGFTAAPRMQALVPQASELELVQAHVVFRHGARSPFNDSPDAPGIWATSLRAKASKLPQTFQLVDSVSGSKRPLSHAMGGSAGAADRSISEERALGGGLNCGMLTEPGLEQARLLGKRLHEAYVETGLVSEPGEVLLRSSLTARTIETLFGCVTALFPEAVAAGKKFDVVVGEKGVGSKHTDWINVSLDSCPRLMCLFNEGVKQWNGARMPADVAAFMDTCQKTPGWSLETAGDARKYGIIAWRDWIACRLGSGLPLQPGVTWPLFERIDAFAAQQAASWFMGGLDRAPDTRRETLSLAHGRTLAEVVGHLCHTSVSCGLFLSAASPRGRFTPLIQTNVLSHT